MDAITIRLYVDANGRVLFEDWLIAFDRSTQSRIEARLARVRTGNLGDHRDLGQGLLELRLFFGAGYRIYLTWDGANVLLLLAGGAKGTQERDIRRARRYLKDVLESRHGTDG